MKTPENIPHMVSQALHWLDTMQVSYRYVDNSSLWEIKYKGWYVLLENDSPDNELCLIMPAIAQGETESDKRRVFDLAYEVTADRLDDASLSYIGDGLCNVLMAWGSTKERPRLYKYKFCEFLDAIYDRQIRFSIALKMAYQMLFPDN